MSTVFSALLVVGLLIAGVASLHHSRKARTQGLRRRHIKWAIGSFGTLAIMGFVTLLGETVQTIVIIAAVIWLARHLYRGTSTWVRFVEEKVANML